jgi:peptide/nickel transport system substrate-binding protein
MPSAPTPGPPGSLPRVRALGVLALATLVAGCSGGGGGPVTGAEGPDSPANQGGTLTVGVVQEPTSFLAGGIVDNMQSAVVVDAPIAEGLLWYRPLEEARTARSLADVWRPMLATEVPTTDNGDVRTSGCPTVTVGGRDTVPAMCVTWKLRGDVLWHDGSRFGAHDVCATAQFGWLRYHDRNPTPLISTWGADQLIDCHEDSPVQATLSYRSRYGAYLTMGTGVYGVMPARLLENAFRTDADLERTPQTVDLTAGTGAPDAYRGTDTLDRIIDGTGPYVLQRDEPGRDIVLVRNRRYWDRAHPPHLDRIVMRFVSDATSQLDQVRAGEIDVGLDYRLAALPDLEDDARQGRLVLDVVPEPGAEKIAVNLCAAARGLCGPQARTNPAIADVRVREAMLRAIDRPQIVRTIARGRSVVPQDSWISLGEEFIHDPAVPTTAYDPAAARSLLDAAGYRLSPACHAGRGRADAAGHCLDLELVTTSDNATRQQTQVAVQADLEQVGIFTTLGAVKAGRLFGGFQDGGVLTTHGFDLAMDTDTGAEPDGWYFTYHSDCRGACPEENQIPSAANHGQGQNVTGLDDPVVDRAFDEGRSTVDLSRRALAYRQAQEALARDLPDIPLYQSVAVNSHTPRLHGMARNDRVWTFSAGDWYCTAGRCQG